MTPDPQSQALLLAVQETLNGAALRILAEDGELLAIAILPLATRGTEALYYPTLPAMRVRALATGTATRFDIVGVGGIVLVESALGASRSGFTLKLNNRALVEGRSVDITSVEVNPKAANITLATAGGA